MAAQAAGDAVAMTAMSRKRGHPRAESTAPRQTPTMRRSATSALRPAPQNTPGVGNPRDVAPAISIDLDRAAEDALMSRIAAGDENAFATLMTPWLRRGVWVASRLLGSPHDAEDVVQTAMLRVWTHARHWRPGVAPFAGWFHHIIRNLCIDVLRERRRATFVPLEMADELIDGAADPMTEVHIWQVAYQLAVAVNALPARQRDVFLMAYLRRMSNRDSARALGISVSALESLLARSRLSLRRKLKELYSAG